MDGAKHPAQGDSEAQLRLVSGVAGSPEAGLAPPVRAYVTGDPVRLSEERNRPTLPLPRARRERWPGGGESQVLVPFYTLLPGPLSAPPGS